MIIIKKLVDTYFILVIVFLILFQTGYLQIFRKKRK